MRAFTMTPHAQPDLFDVRAPFAIDSDFTSARRTMLDAHTWVEVVPNWITGSSVVFEALQSRVPWKQHYREIFEQRVLEPRLTAEYRDIRDAPDPALIEITAVLSKHYGVGYDSLWLNWYRNGADSTGWHRDRFSCRLPECIVPVLTLGAKRQFLLKPRSGGRSIGFTPGSGDLIVMGGRCQQDWVHSVPKIPGLLEPRISLNFQSSEQARRITRTSTMV